MRYDIRITINIYFTVHSSCTEAVPDTYILIATRFYTHREERFSFASNIELLQFKYYIQINI